MGCKSIQVPVDELSQIIVSVCNQKVSERSAQVIARMIIKSEMMGVSSHGLHYFLYTIYPLVQQRLISRSKIKIEGNIIQSDGTGGVGFKNTLDCLRKGSALAQKRGSSIITFKNPGKVGALRIYCQEFMDAGQLIILLKNTAPTVGLKEISKPLIGTNPLCIGLPDSQFIYDSSLSTVATNKLRVTKKKGSNFKSVVGVNKEKRLTKNPNHILSENGYLLPFSYNGYAYKGFFLGVVIECLAAMAGGKTSTRVGKNKGKRLYSDEGMLAIIIDKKAFPNYENYLKEMPLLFKDIKKYKLRLPGSYTNVKKVTVLERDYKELNRK